MLRKAGQTAEMFCGHSWVAVSCNRLKKTKICFLKIFKIKKFQGQNRAFKLVNNMQA